MLRLLRHIQVCPDTAQKIKFSIKDFFTKCDQIRSLQWFPVDLVRFTEEIVNGKLIFYAVYNLSIFGILVKEAIFYINRML